jgi:hypothetical protein
MKEDPIVCSRGFHYCIDLQDVFKYYGGSCIYSKRYALVEILGKIDTSGDEFCTNKIKIVREVDYL